MRHNRNQRHQEQDTQQDNGYAQISFHNRMDSSLPFWQWDVPSPKPMRDGRDSCMILMPEHRTGNYFTTGLRNRQIGPSVLYCAHLFKPCSGGFDSHEQTSGVSALTLLGGGAAFFCVWRKTAPVLTQQPVSRFPAAFPPWHWGLCWFCGHWGWRGGSGGFPATGMLPFRMLSNLPAPRPPRLCSAASWRFCSPGFWISSQLCPPLPYS